MSETELVELKAQTPGHIFDYKPREMVTHAAVIADVLKDVIDKQKLYTTIGQKKHVRVDGWATLGTMLNILPKEDRVIEHDDGSFEAHVNLINSKTGAVVGGASSLCGMDETRWKSADRYARRSMAVTRATGKAYRLGFAWIMSLAGYESTPYEEMPEVPFEDKKSSKGAKKSKEAAKEVYTGTSNQKVLLASIFEKLKVEPKRKAEIHAILVAHKIEFSKDVMEKAVKECLDDNLEIPF